MPRPARPYTVACCFSLFPSLVTAPVRLVSATLPCPPPAALRGSSLLVRLACGSPRIQGWLLHRTVRGGLRGASVGTHSRDAPATVLPMESPLFALDKSSCVSCELRSDWFRNLRLIFCFVSRFLHTALYLLGRGEATQVSGLG